MSNNQPWYNELRDLTPEALDDNVRTPLSAWTTSRNRALRGHYGAKYFSHVTDEDDPPEVQEFALSEYEKCFVKDHHHLTPEILAANLEAGRVEETMKAGPSMREAVVGWMTRDPFSRMLGRVAADVADQYLAAQIAKQVNYAADPYAMRTVAELLGE